MKLKMKIVIAVMYLVKVQIFWEVHKNLAHLPLFIWHYLVASNYQRMMGQNFVAFSEYLNFTSNPLYYLGFTIQFHKMGVHWKPVEEQKMRPTSTFKRELPPYSSFFWHFKNPHHTFSSKAFLFSFSLTHGLRTLNEGINQRNLKIWANAADKICFGRT